MTLRLNLDQHRLMTTEEGAIVVTNDTFKVFDLLSKTTVDIPSDQLSDVVSFLGKKPSVVVKVAPAPVVMITSSASTSAGARSGDSAASLPEEFSSVSSPPTAEIWVKNSGKPSAIDLKAREDLINLVKSDKYQRLFNDEKTTRKCIYKEIAAELVKIGYSFGEREPWKVCKQKWKNMEAEILRVIAAAGAKNSGGGQVKKPEYFDDEFGVVKDTAKACPKNIVDSLPVANEVAIRNDENNKTDHSPFDEEEEEVDASNENSSPFLKVNSSSKPSEKRVNTNEILTFLKQDAAKKDKQNDQLLKLLAKKAKKDDKRKKDFLGVLRELAGSKKRKKESSSEEDDSGSSSSE